MPTTYINDQWVQEDLLGLGRAGDAVARVALQAQAPFTIGVTGKWGCGKTSVMRRAFATLGGRPISQDLQFGLDKPELDAETLDVMEKLFHRNGARTIELNWGDLHEVADQSLCIWYSPWQHQDAGNPLIPLLQEIRAQYQVKRNTFLGKIKESAKKLNRQGGLAALTLIEHLIDAAASFMSGRPVKMAVGLSENVRKAWNEENPESLAKPGDGQRFHLLFEDAVEMLLADLRKVAKKDNLSDYARLIIFIDDLDRCEEKSVVLLLEAIKLYLGTKRCVFVLGVDEAAVADALRRYWQRGDDSNREYLEKLFQATLPVPQPRPAKLEGLITQQLIEHEFPAAVIRDLVTDIQSLLEPNPRKVKNFLNSLCANWQVLKCAAMQDAENCRRLVMFQYLRANHRAVWRLLEREPVLLQVLQRVLAGHSPDPYVGFPAHVSKDDLRLTEEVISRSFTHVLKHHESGDLKFHRGQSLDSAVESALERLDRRRSDQYFVNWVITGGITFDESLSGMYLQVTADE